MHSSHLPRARPGGLLSVRSCLPFLSTLLYSRISKRVHVQVEAPWRASTGLDRSLPRGRRRTPRALPLPRRLLARARRTRRPQGAPWCLPHQRLRVGRTGRQQCGLQALARALAAGAPRHQVHVHDSSRRPRRGRRARGETGVADGREDRLTLVKVLRPVVVCGRVQRHVPLARGAVVRGAHGVRGPRPRRLTPARDVR